MRNLNKLTFIKCCTLFCLFARARWWPLHIDKVIECSCKENYNIDNIFKAYLSLAKVSLSSALMVNLGGKKRSPHKAPAAIENNDDTIE